MGCNDSDTPDVWRLVLRPDEAQPVGYRPLAACVGVGVGVTGGVELGVALGVLLGVAVGVGVADGDGVGDGDGELPD
jgi:hypothetical protein